MPLYDYACRACDARFEALVRASDAEPACPACGGAAVERLPSFGAVRSATTRDVVARETRHRDAAQARERVHEQRRYERSHDD